MSVYYPTNNCGGGAVAQYTCNPCPEYEYSRIRSIAFVKNSVSFSNPSSPTEWDTAIGAGDAIIIWATQGSYDGGTSVELPGFGDAEFVNGGASHILTYKDASVSDNCDFYNSIRSNTEYTVWFRTSSKIWAAGTPVSVTPKMPIADDLKAVLAYEVTVKWSNPDLPCGYDIPDGIFTNCYIPIVV